MSFNGHVIDFVEVRPGVMEPEESPEKSLARADREILRNILAVCAIPVVITAGIWVWAMMVN